MKHRKRIVKLGRMTSHRKAMLNNMASSIIIYKRIETTVPKAKAVVPVIDKLITWGKNGSLASQRLAFRILKDRTLVKTLFSEVAPALRDRPGGYTRITKAGVRAGDGAPLAVLELLDQEITARDDKKAKVKKKEKADKNKEKEK